MSRKRAVAKIKAALMSEGYPRLQMLLLVGVTGGAGFLTSFLASAWSRRSCSPPVAGLVSAPPVEGYHLDILTRLGEVYAFGNLETQRLDFDGLEITVVTPRMLWKMKKDTVRPKDWDDAALLRRRFQLED